MNKFNRIFMIVTDSLGIGGDPRQKEFGDEGANTLYHVSQTGLLEIPNWKKLGIDSIAKLEGFNKSVNQTAYTARVQELSNAKDTLAGHWEMMGYETKISFPTFTDTGFPKELLDELSKAFDGRKIVGNKASSGTTIINEMAHLEKDENAIIIYTSGDSVLQICGHEEWMGVEKLWEFGKKAREICNSKPEWKVGRIIVRPYIGSNGQYSRTYNRHDYGVMPPEKLITNDLQEKGVKVRAIGKINDILGGQGVTENIHSDGDADGMDKTIDIAMEKNTKDEFIFVNLVDFDAKFGHRRDIEGYAKNINLFDIKIGKLVNALNKDDLLIITSDHGNDPSFPGSDHTRENLPATIYSSGFKGKPKALDTFNGMATLGNIVAKNFGVPIRKIGEDRTNEII